MPWLVFNELSTPPHAAAARDPIEAQRWLQSFAEILLDGRIPHPKRLAVPEGFPRTQLAEGYSIGRWIKELSLEREQRERLQFLIANREEFPPGACQPERECRCDSTVAVGLGLALDLGGLAVSVASGPQWLPSSIPVVMSRLAQGGEEIIDEIIKVDHASSIANLNELGFWLSQQGLQLPCDGRALWGERAQRFPNLDFCHSVEPQVVGILGTGPELKAVARGLYELQRYCDSWECPGFVFDGLTNASPESEATLTQYGAERTFVCPGGISRVFSFHLKVPGFWRIYFIPEPDGRRFLIGYAGGHLRTAKFN